MKCLVTGAAGFIGSHLCERLLTEGHEVVGLDAFIPYYPRAVKEANLASCRAQRRFSFHALDLRQDSLDEAFDRAEVIFHLAAMPGLAASWTDFDLYLSCNVTATQRLLEAAQRVKTLKRLVLASTSSVYGRDASGDETLPTRPISPYGVTKFAAEQLARAYADERGLPLVVLRYFSVYGPRQRPDMGYNRFVQALLQGETIPIFGDGLQSRGNTYVSDCVDATLRAASAPVGETYNVGGGEVATVLDILGHLERITGRRANLRREAARPGDQRTTGADTTKLERQLGWRPRVSLVEGLTRQVEWQQQRGARQAA